MFAWLGNAVSVSWGWLAGNYAPLALLVATASAMAALIALYRTARDSADRSRPMVTAEFERAKDSSSAFDLVIRNYGQTIARNLTVSFDGPLDVEGANDWDVGRIIEKRYIGKTFHSFSPGQEFRNVYYCRKEVPGQRRATNLYETPESVRVTLHSEDSKGRSYDDYFDLESDALLLTTESISSNSQRRLLEYASESLKKIAANSQKISAHFDSEDSGWGKIRPEDLESQYELFRRVGFGEEDGIPARPQNRIQSVLGKLRRRR